MPEVTIGDDHVIPFGKHKGKTMAEIPASYHLYMYKMDIYYGAYKHYVMDRLDKLRKMAKEEEK